MTASRRIGDRREHLRFEVIGALTASMLSTETLRVLNLGPTGALVEGAVALQANAEYAMRLILETHISEVQVRVRRVMPIGQDPETVRYLIGLEFMRLTREAEETIGRLILLEQAES
jgi:hypothetical protein